MNDPDAEVRIKLPEGYEPPDYADAEDDGSDPADVRLPRLDIDPDGDDDGDDDDEDEDPFGLGLPPAGALDPGHGYDTV